MKIIKKICNYVLICSMLFSLTGCSGSLNTEKKSNGKLKIVATVFAEYDFLRNIGKDKIDLSLMLKPGADLHAFDPSPKDIGSVQSSDLFVTIGGDSDAWSKKITDSIDNKKIKIIKLMDCVKLVEEEKVEGMESEEEEDSDDEKEFDEHVWTSPKNAIQIVNKLCDTLCSLDQKNAKSYKENASAYVEKLKKLDASFTDVVNSAKRKEIIVADRFPFRYFADAYHLKYYAAFPGCSTQTGASAETVSFLINKVKQDKIPVVFHMELSSQSMADTICKETGAKKEQLNAVHNVSKTDFDKGIGYVELMQKNVAVLKEALN